jgi:hypothetical protein
LSNDSKYLDQCLDLYTLVVGYKYTMEFLYGITADTSDNGQGVRIP